MKLKNRQNVSENTDGTIFDYTNLDTFPIEEQLEHNILNAINEAYEISNEVERETKNLVSLIKNYLQRSPKYRPYKENENYTNYFSVFSFSYKCFGTNELKVICKIHNCKNSECIKIFETKCTSGVNCEDRTLFLELCLNNGKFTNGCNGIISHELTHYYQYLMRGNKNVNNAIDKKLYERCCSIILAYTNHNNENNLETKKYYVACALYLSFKSENEAFFHEFDQQLKGTITKENWKLVFLNSNLYENLKLIRNIISKENEYKGIIKQVLGINPKNYFNRLKVAEKQIIRGIGRVINKHISEPISEIYIKPKFPW